MTFVPTLTLNPTVDNSALIDRVVADTERLFRNIKNKEKVVQIISVHF